MKLLKLKDVCSVNSGISPPKDKKIFENGTVPFYKTLDVGRIKIGNISDSELKVSQAFADSKKVFEPGTILFPKSGASTLLNHRVVIQKKGLVASTLAAIVPIKDLCLSKYLYYYLLTIDAKDFIPESFYPGMKISEISEIPIPVPSLQEQQKIVERLDKVFGEVDNMLKNLKNKNAQSLDLYESILKNTFLNINSDYEPIENFCNEIFAGGDRPKEFSKTPDETFKYKIFSNGITNNGLYGFSSKYRIKDTALTISARGTIGHLEIRNEPFTPIIRLITIVPKDFLHLEFLYHFLKYSLNLKTGSVIPQLTVPMIKKIQIPKLSMHNQKKISELLDSVLLKSIDLRMIIEKQEILFDDFKKSILIKEFSYE